MSRSIEQEQTRKSIHSIAAITGILLFISLLIQGLSAQDNLPLFHSLEAARLDIEVPVLLIFFSTRCHACWEDLFEMKSYLEKNNLLFRLVGVSHDREDELTEFMNKYSFHSPVICDSNKKIFRKFRVTLEPFMILLYRDNILCRDDYYQQYEQRREKFKNCLLNIALK